MPEITIQITSAGVDKEGEKNGKKWKRFFVMDAVGDRYTTFDGALFNAGNAAVGHSASIVYEQTQYGRDLKHLEVVAGSTYTEPVQPSPAPAVPSTRQPDGEVDWDRVGLQKVRCALWKEVLPVLCQGLHFDDAKKLVVFAEADIYHRNPPVSVEDGLPF